MALRASDAEWLRDQIETVPHSHEVITPSEWAERDRYLPPSVTMMPGQFRFSRSPFLKEIVDCMSVDSPIREVALMKGVQIGATTGVLENAIGYFMAHVQTSPMMLVTADRELAALRLENNVIQMVQLSELGHLIKSSDEKNPRKTGSTGKKIEWVGGGFLIPQGANSANKMRQTSIEIMLRDEIDGWPDVVGTQGDPIELTFGRTKGYEASRKIFDASTPLVKGTSKIERRFLRGDQRHYFVRCLRCGFPQVLSGYGRDFKWRSTDPQTGEVTGLVWETDGGLLVPESVRYCCKDCGHGHTNHEKTQLLSPDHGAEWRPTAEPIGHEVRSYHLSALYSPVQSWQESVRGWLAAWDEENARVRDKGQLQVFYNNILGLTWEVTGDKVRPSQVYPHRRSEYIYGQVPNEFARDYCGGPIVLLTCAVDVHGDNLAVGVFGWTRGGRAILIDYWRLRGDTEHLDDPGTWIALRDILESREYVADDGTRYRIWLTLVDAGFRSDQVKRFCGQYEGGVYPIFGRTETARSKRNDKTNFQPFKADPLGVVSYGILVDRYKDRWSAALKRDWSGLGEQPAPFFNAPEDATNPQLEELAVEVRRAVEDKDTGQVIGHEWHRPGNAANELWDLLVYNTAAMEIVAWDVCVNQFEADEVDWSWLFDLAESEGLFVEAA